MPTDLEPVNGPPVAASAAPAAGTRPSRSSAREHAAFIEGEVAKGRNAAAIYQDLVGHHGYTGSDDAIKRFARRIPPTEPKVSCRFETEPGVEAQVDYGDGAPTRDARIGKYRKPRLFVMALGMSRHAFGNRRSSQQVWCKDGWIIGPFWRANKGWLG